MKNALKRDVQGIQELKQIAHDLIDDIVRLGYARDDVYLRLADKLNCLPESAHFYNMFTEREVRRAITALGVIKATRTHQIAERREEERKARIKAQQEAREAARRKKAQELMERTRKAKSDVLPLAEQRRLLALQREGKLQPQGRTEAQERAWSARMARGVRAWGARFAALFGYRI